MSILIAALHFAILATDPHWTCAVTHRDPGVAGTYYLYCSQVAPDGVEMIDVGHFVSDARAQRAQGKKP